MRLEFDDMPGAFYWACDADRCPEETELDSYDKAEADGWWEKRGVHLCAAHNPERR
jgi:hypothetical protein